MCGGIQYQEHKSIFHNKMQDYLFCYEVAALPE